MTPPQPQQHCDHERKDCGIFCPVTTFEWCLISGCPADTRTRPHTSSTERDYQDDDCIWMTPEEEEKRIRAHERNATLDNILSFISAHEEYIGLDNIDGFEIYGVKSVNLKEHIESLRSTKEQPPSEAIER